MAYKIKSKAHPKFGVVYEIVKTKFGGLSSEVVDSFYVDKKQAEDVLKNIVNKKAPN